MTRNEAVRITRQANTLRSLGFTDAEAETLRRISRTLHRWAEHECNGNIERTGDNGDGLPYWSNPHTGQHLIYRIPDRERGAMKRLRAIIGQRNGRPSLTNGRLQTVSAPVTFYVQGDPRGCMLYIIRHGDVPDGKPVDSYYTRGIAVY